MDIIYKNSDSVTLYQGDCVETMRTLPDNSIDSIVTDPPYELGFMNKKWDSTGIANNVEMWRECLRVLKPGGHLLSFGGTRTYHRMACAIEDAGFEIRDQMQWLYGCLSEDTEILTSDGWRSKDSIRLGDTIFSVDLLDFNVIPNRVKHVFEYKYTGEMVHLFNDNTDQLLTPNHKVICQEGCREQSDKVRKVLWDKHFRYKDAEFINCEHYKLPMSGFFDGDYSIGKDFAELIGWVLSEGHFHKDTNAISIYQSSVNAEYVTRIKYVLGRCGIKYSHYEREREYKQRSYVEHQFYLSGEIVDKIKNVIPNKLPTSKLWYLPLKEKQRLFHGLCAGDGSLGRNNKFAAFYQKDKVSLEWFQVLLHLMGMQGRINGSKSAVSIHYNSLTEIQGKHYPDRRVSYDGIVWCIETDVGNFFARRNGKIFVTGNSGFPKSMNIGKAIDKQLGHTPIDIGESPNWRESKRNREQFGKMEVRGENAGRITIPASPQAEEWEGWGTCLKPANEPICLARKPISEKTIAENVLKWGTGGLNIDACRIPTNPNVDDMLRSVSRQKRASETWEDGSGFKNENNHLTGVREDGRFPANIILDREAGKLLDSQSGINRGAAAPVKKGYAGESNGIYGDFETKGDDGATFYGDTGGASRFFYCAKASKSERNAGLNGMDKKTAGSLNFRNPSASGRSENAPSVAAMGGITKAQENHHPTVKPIKLIEYLVRLITPPNGTVLDPFMGSGTTGVASKNLGFKFIGIEMEKEYCEIADKRISASSSDKQIDMLDMA